MALTQAQRDQLRQMVSEPDAQNGWTDTALELVASRYINDDGTYNLRGIAAEIWEAKAAAFVESVRVSESGSSRDMNQKFDHAMVMAKQFGSTPTGEEDPSTTAPRSTKIVRATR